VAARWVCDCPRSAAPLRRVRELDRHRPGAPVVRPTRGRLPAAQKDPRGRRLHPPESRPRAHRRRLSSYPTGGIFMTYRETRRILLDGNIVDVVRQGDTLVAHDG